MKMLLLLFPDKWKYYINLTGEEFPLVTNAELVSILSRLKGTNAAESKYNTNSSFYAPSAERVQTFWTDKKKTPERVYKKFYYLFSQ